MTKMIGAAEFKAKCLALLDEVQATGEAITVTKRGKPVALVSAVDATTEARPGKPIFGALKGTGVIHGDLDEPIDPDWEAKWLAKWDEKLRDGRAPR